MGKGAEVRKFLEASNVVRLTGGQEATSIDVNKLPPSSRVTSEGKEHVEALESRLSFAWRYMTPFSPPSQPAQSISPSTSLLLMDSVLREGVQRETLVSMDREACIRWIYFGAQSSLSTSSSIHVWERSTVSNVGGRK